MMNDLQRKAKEQSLQSLTSAMGEDDMKPLLTIKISAGAGSETPAEVAEEPGDEMEEGPAEEGDTMGLMEGAEGGDPFMELLKKKMQEKMGK